MSDPYPERGFATEHERWAESEARFCDQMVESLLETVHTYSARVVKYSDKPVYQHVSAMAAHHPAKDAYECAIRAAVWQQMADNLRRPRISRIESAREATPEAEIVRGESSHG